MKKRWTLPEPMPAEFRDGFPEMRGAALQLLWNRGIRTQAEADVFLGPDWGRDTHDPHLFSRMDEAVARVFRALEAGEKLVVHGDYDADGVCGSTVLVSTLREACRALGHDASKVGFYIPHREHEGYGLSVPTMEKLAQEGAKLVVTVDCGISNGPAIARGRELGVDTIVCDHHAMPPELPKDAILLHPQVPGETYPNKHLCGTGVAFKFACGLIAEARRRGAPWPEGHEKWLLDLVAIATVTDVMPLRGENRTLERYGLLVLNKTRRVGLRKLVEVAGGKFGALDTFAIGFVIGPRLNAAGRMRHASLAVELLLQDDEAKALALAQELQVVNAQRKQASDAMYEEAKRMVGDPTGRSVLFVVAEGWSPGLVGLVAGKLLSDFGLPVYVVGRDGEKFVGSGRSASLDVTRALHAAKDCLEKFGGHPQACGFTVLGEAQFHRLVERVEAHAEEALADADASPTLPCDATLALEDLSWPLVDDLQRFEPFGEGNARPRFLVPGVTVLAFDAVGNRGAHLRLTVGSAGGKLCKAIGFRLGPRIGEISPGMRLDLAGEISVNEWNGNRELQLKIDDFRPAV